MEVNMEQVQVEFNHRSRLLLLVMPHKAMKVVLSLNMSTRGSEYSTRFGMPVGPMVKRRLVQLFRTRNP